MRNWDKIVTAAFALASGAALNLMPGAYPALAQSAPLLPGVVVGQTSSGAGTLLSSASHKVFLPRGMISVGLLYPASTAFETYYGMSAAERQDLEDECSSGVPSSVWDELSTAVTAMIGDPDAQLLAMKEHWQANTVRFHLSEGALAWESKHPSDTAYTNAAASVIQQARAMGLMVIVDMDTEPYSCTSGASTQRLPDAETKMAWTQFLSALGNTGEGSDRGIILEPLNEPNSGTACGTQDWSNWADGCSGYIGMVDIAKWLRGKAPDNVILLGGDHDAGTFEGYVASSYGVPANTAYAVHPYYYIVGPVGTGTEPGWNERFGDLEAASGQGQAVIADAWNESATCSSDPNHYGRQLVTSYLPGHNIGLALQAWDAPDAALDRQPLGAADRTAADPVDSIGQCPTGADLAYNRYWYEAGSPSVAAPAVQVSALSWIPHKNILNGVNLELGDNGSPYKVTPVVGPHVVSSVHVLVQKAGSRPVLIGTMKVSTVAEWDNGTLTSATISRLSQKPPTVAPGDTLVFRVRYQGVSGYTDTDYLVPPASASFGPVLQPGLARVSG